MEELIPLINKLQSVFQSTGYDEIQLPQIVVVGAQSAGKSSVLESLVGRSFLPRGSGMVTRCPTVLQLIHIAEEQEEWCVFANDPDPKTKYTDYEKVREKIEEQTKEAAGDNMGISKDPIIIQVFSPRVVSLTVVDLPGIVKNPVTGQPADIEDQIQKLILNYIQNKNSLILAVSAANADMATSESIKMAKDADPNGDRTLAVITKLDLMDRGTNAMKTLDGELIKVELGIIGVVNRSQQDIDENKTIKDAMDYESKFLENNYPSKFKLGTIGSKYLATRLNELLVMHIKSSLPGLIKRIDEMTNEYELKKKELGEEIAVEEHGSHWFIFQVMEQFVKDYDSQVKGRQTAVPTFGKLRQEQLLGARIAEIFDKFGAELKNNSTLDNILPSDDDLSKAIWNTVNVERYTYIEGVFKTLVRERIKDMERYSLKCADSVQEALSDAVAKSLKDKRLQKLNDEIVKIANRLLKAQLKETKDAIMEYILVQTEMIFTTDEKFLAALNGFGLDDNDSKARKLSDRFGLDNNNSEEKGTNGQSSSTASPFLLSSTIKYEGKECNYIRSLVSNYIAVVRCQISDYIPKHIMHYLYENTMKKISNEILSVALEKGSELVKEPPSIVQSRKEVNQMLKSLHEAYEVIRSIKDSTTIEDFKIFLN